MTLNDAIHIDIAAREAGNPCPPAAAKVIRAFGYTPLASERKQHGNRT